MRLGIDDSNLDGLRPRRWAAQRLVNMGNAEAIVHDHVDGRPVILQHVVIQPPQPSIEPQAASIRTFHLKVAYAFRRRSHELAGMPAHTCMTALYRGRLRHDDRGDLAPYGTA